MLRSLVGSEMCIRDSPGGGVMFAKLMQKARKIRGPVNNAVFPTHLVSPTYTEEGPADGSSWEEHKSEMFWIETVPCILFPADQPSHRVLIYAHCNAEDAWNSHNLLRALRDGLPAHVIVFEYPGYGVAGGHASDDAINNAISMVYRWVIEKQAVPPNDVLLCGRSIGTGPCTWLAAQQPNVGGLIMISAFSSVKAVVKNTTHEQGRIMVAAGSAAQYLIQDRYKNGPDKNPNLRVF
eukprot:TRINITY_DN11295_c0_g1_i4.p2 TRINITY_DN11295_c0_g1~~TRINITY_DN11295_c0_g1_i4.p2  ORF type:complete len:237 (-),score=54.82 TRINITY_DN11295_c0_g1_i4:528-1238(-)